MWAICNQLKFIVKQITVCLVLYAHVRNRYILFGNVICCFVI